MTHDQFRLHLQRLCEAAGSQTAWAAQHGLSKAYVSDVLRNRRDPSQRICREAGVERRIAYRLLRDKPVPEEAANE